MMTSSRPLRGRAEELVGHLGMQELILIFIVALLVFGPRKLPELGQSLGKGLREFRRATNEMKATWNDQMRDAENEVRSTARDLRDVEREIRRDTAPRREDAPKKPSAGESPSEPSPPAEEADRESQTPS